MPLYNRLNLKCPCFDLAWISFPGEGGTEEQSFVLIPGGGGSTKSGVHNIIHVARDAKKLGTLEFLKSFETGALLCNSLSTGSIKNTSIVCASFDEFCHIFVVKLNGNDDLSFEKVAEFKADFSEQMSSVNCSVIISRAGSSGYVITGGEDGVCRVWNITIENDKWTVALQSSLKAHTGPVMTLSVGSPKIEIEDTREPTSSTTTSSYWLASGSRDGTIRLWDVKSGTRIGGIRLEPIKDPKVDTKKNVPTKATTQIQLQCRGCVGSRGATHLLKAEIRLSESVTNSLNDRGAVGPADMELYTTTIGCVMASKNPCTRLRISEVCVRTADTELLAVGGSDGSITVFRQSDLSQVLMIPEVHDFPVTGLGFRPASLGITALASLNIPDADVAIAALDTTVKDGVTLVSCSADNRLISLQIKPIKSGMSILWMLTIIFILFMSIFAAYIIIYHDEREYIIILQEATDKAMLTLLAEIDSMRPVVERLVDKMKAFFQQSKEL
eukprot:gene1983-3860_t